MALAMDNDMTMVCFGLNEENSIVRVVRGEEIGTTVKNHSKEEHTMTVDFKEYSRRMDKALEHLDEEFASVRAGRANAKVLDRITVEYYGSETPLNGSPPFPPPTART